MGIFKNCFLNVENRKDKNDLESLLNEEKNLEHGGICQS